MFNHRHNRDSIWAFSCIFFFVIHSAVFSSAINNFPPFHFALIFLKESFKVLIALCGSPWSVMKTETQGFYPENQIAQSYDWESTHFLCSPADNIPGNLSYLQPFANSQEPKSHHQELLQHRQGLFNRMLSQGAVTTQMLCYQSLGFTSLLWNLLQSSLNKQLLLAVSGVSNV